MNAKNLWLKFTFVALLVALCLYSYKTHGLQQGIDLRGGHSMIFEIRGNEAEISKLEAQKADLQAQLDQVGEGEQAEDLREQLEGVEGRIMELSRTQQGDLSAKMIAILKDRIDPNGLMALEWTPLGNNRLEIRMPAGDEKSEALRVAYFRSLDQINENNIHLSEIRTVFMSDPQQQAEKIAEYTRGNDEAEARFRELVVAHQALAQAEAARNQAEQARSEALKKSANPSNLAQLEAAMESAKGQLSNAQVDYEDKLDDLLGYNISVSRLQQMLRNYVSKAEKKKLGNIPDVQRREQAFEAEVQALKDSHSSRVEEISQAVDSFKNWANVRRYLGDPDDLKRLIAKAGVLEFRVAPMSPEVGGPYAIPRDERDSYVQALQDEGPEALRRQNTSYLWFPLRDEDIAGYHSMVLARRLDKNTQAPYGPTYILLENRPGYVLLQEPGQSSWSLTGARPYMDPNGQLVVLFQLDESGARKFANLTGPNIGRNMAILLDDEVYSAPTIRDRISGSGTISGNFTQEDVQEMVRTLEAGSLPARLNPEPVSVSSFGPTIGAINRERGIRAAVWGLAAVAAFMLFYYLLAGAIADVALMLNIILVIGTMSLLEAVFTLPGIAGLILTIGIAVDANVLIFERLREEQAKNQPLALTIKSAYDRAFSAIFDANITTLLVCLILGGFGNEEIRGFAITLGLGVVFSMFTALVVTRWIFLILLKLGILRKHISMLKIIGIPHVRWMSKRYFFWIVSLGMMVLGLVSVAVQGSNIFGIEFSSGTQATITFRSDALIDGRLLNDGLVREKFKSQAQKLNYEALAATARVETKLDPDAVDKFIRDHDDPRNSDGQISKAEWEARDKDLEFFAMLDKNGDGVLTREELLGSLPPTSFQISTTETSIEKIQKTARDAFGNALEIRLKRDFERVVGQRVAALGVDVPATGEIEIAPEMRREMTPVYREDLLGYDGGVLFVINNITPAIDRVELLQRIDEMRQQPDFSAQSGNEATVLGLAQDSSGRYTEVAIAIRPSDTRDVEGKAARDAFASGGWDLVKAALEKEQAMNVRSFDAQLAGESAWKAGFAVVISWLVIVLYLWFRFGNWRWGLAAVVCLIHDVIIVVGLVAASAWIQNTTFGRMLGIQSFKIDLAMIAAILTVIGYSVNDTIVVFDRIRENRGKLTSVNEQVIDLSINQTLSRTLLTSGTTFIVVIIMYVMGGDGIHAFNFALLAGIIFGTYSSVAVASPLLMGFRKALVNRTIANTND